MRKWDGKPTSVLNAWVRELREKNTTKGDSTRKNAGPVSKQSRRADLISDPLEGNSEPILREVNTEYSNQN